VLLFFVVKVVYSFRQSRGLGNILGEFFTNSSGHPGYEWVIKFEVPILNPNETFCPLSQSRGLDNLPIPPRETFFLPKIQKFSRCLQENFHKYFWCQRLTFSRLSDAKVGRKVGQKIGQKVGLSKCRRKLCAGQSTFFDIIRHYSTFFDIIRRFSTSFDVSRGEKWIRLNLNANRRWLEPEDLTPVAGKTVFLRFCYCFAKKLSF
jgi:hypothetical protein